MKKPLGLAVLAATLFTVSAHAATFDFSYTFADSRVITGRLDGTANGNLVTDLSNIYVKVNGVDFAGSGSLLAARYDGTRWRDDAVVSFTGLENNFLFTDGSFAGSYDVNYFTQRSGPGLDFSWVESTRGFKSSEIYTVTPGGTLARWRLTAVTAVPEPETYAMLLAGLGLLGAVARRRRQA